MPYNRNRHKLAGVMSMMVGPLLFAWGLLIFISDQGSECPGTRETATDCPVERATVTEDTTTPPLWQNSALLGMTLMTAAGIVMGFGAVGVVHLVRDSARAPRQRSRSRYGPGPP